MESYRGVVYPWECDMFEHMNVQHYVAKFDSAAWHFLASIGLSPDYFRTYQRGAFAVEQHIKYLHEMRAGSLVVIRTKLVSFTPKSIRYLHRMSNENIGKVCAEMDITAVHVDLQTRKSCAIPAEIQKRLQSLEPKT
ncbi:MAG: thioesterase family protein [Bacteroidota bacterium]